MLLINNNYCYIQKKNVTKYSYNCYMIMFLNAHINYSHELSLFPIIFKHHEIHIVIIISETFIGTRHIV